MKIDNFLQIEEIMKFPEDKHCFYNFSIIVRNKDGASPLINKESASGETLIKTWYVDSWEYYNKIKPCMIALAKATRGRLYMGLDRKDSYKVMFAICEKIIDTIKHAMFGDTSTPRRLNKLVRSITACKENSTHSGRYWMYDIDSQNNFVKLALCTYLLERVKHVHILNTKNGYHVVAPRSYKIENDWQSKVCDIALIKLRELYGENYRVPLADAEEICRVVCETKVQENQLTLAYYEEED